MFRNLLLDPAMLWWAGLPLAVAFVLFVAACIYWYIKLKPSGVTFSYAPDTFRNPINAAITVCGFFIPLLCAGIGYLIEKSIPSRQLIPLVAALILFSASVLLGLFNLFSMTIFTGDNVDIKKDNGGGFVPQFATQLAIMCGGLVVVVLYFLLVFDLKTSEAKTTDPSVSILVSKPMLRVGMKSDDVLQSWGAPNQTEKTNQLVVLHYTAGNSEFLITVRDNSVWSIEERKK